MASVTQMDVPAADHVVLYALRKGGAQASLTSGFIVSAGARLCPIVFPGPTVDPGGTSAGLQEAIVRGYLVTSRR